MTGRPEPARRYRDDERRLDGRACVVCGREGGPMIPVGHGPRGQLFAHRGCVENVEREGDEPA